MIISLIFFQYLVYLILITTVLVVPSLQAPADDSPESKTDLKKAKVGKLKSKDTEWDMSVLTLDEMSTTMRPRSMDEVIEERLSTVSKSIGSEVSGEMARALCDILHMNEVVESTVTKNFGMVNVLTEFPVALYLPQCVKWVLRPCEGIPALPFDPECSFWMPLRDSYPLDWDECRNGNYSLYDLPKSSKEESKESPTEGPTDKDDQKRPSDEDNTQKRPDKDSSNDGSGTSTRRKRMIHDGAIIDGMEAVSLCASVSMLEEMYEMNGFIEVAYEAVPLKLDEMSDLRCYNWIFDGEHWVEHMIPMEECERRNEFRYANLASETFSHSEAELSDIVRCKSVGELVTCGFFQKF